jgi:septal ring factor EnvC (AmiA/AmiB activator)
LGKERELEATTQRLDATYQAGESTYQELEAARHELQAADHELQTIRAELQVTSYALDQTRLQLDEVRQRQLPLDELGSRGVKWALRALRLYRRAKSALPSFARAAKSSSPAPPPQFSRLARRRSQSERVEH